MNIAEAMQVQEQLRDAAERLENVIDFLDGDDEPWDDEIRKLEQAANLVIGQLGNF